MISQMSAFTVARLIPGNVLPPVWIQQEVVIHYVSWVQLYWKQQEQINCAELLSEKLDVRQTVGKENNEMAQLVDGLVLLYNMSAHKQLGKVRTRLFVIL